MDSINIRYVGKEGKRVCLEPAIGAGKVSELVKSNLIQERSGPDSRSFRRN